MLQDEDVTYLKDIVSYADETKEPMVCDELAKYDCIDLILQTETEL